MELRDRLNSLKTAPKRAAVSAYHDPAPLPYLEPVETPEGLTYRLDKIFIEYHGQIDFKNYPPLDLDTLRFLSMDRSLQGVALEDFAFLDIETTGTAGGTGTYAFLVGIGFVEKGYFQVRQFFLHDLACEGAFLSALQEFCARFRCLVTYNGKCFDAQILKTRYLMHRRPDPLEGIQHIDMLFIARRLWKRKHRECNLVNLEQKVLNFHRRDDIPGFLIPSAYTDYLRYANSSLIQQVLHHNQWDIASLAVLTARACLLRLQPQDLSPEEHFSLSLLCERHKDFKQAITHQLEALGMGCEFRESVLRSIARNLRRCKDHQGMQWFVREVEGESLDSDLCKRISILCEHDLKDPQLALRFVQGQIERSEKFRKAGTPRDPSLTEWLHRRDRLNRKRRSISALPLEP